MVVLIFHSDSLKHAPIQGNQPLIDPLAHVMLEGVPKVSLA